MKTGDFVKFSWWSAYRAPSININDNGLYTWHEILPGEVGIVLCTNDEDAAVLFPGIDVILRVHISMLEII